MTDGSQISRWRDSVDTTPAAEQRDAATRVSDVAMFVESHISLGRAFASHYLEIRRLAEDEGLGVAAIAVNLGSGALRGRAWAPRLESKANAISIGRHSHCDLILDESSTSLRHSVVLIGPTESGTRRFSIHDLESEPLLRDPSDRELRAAHAEGIAAFRVGSHALFVLATGTGDRWPDDPSVVWTDITQSDLDGDQRARVKAARARAPGEPSESDLKARVFRFRSEVVRVDGPTRTQVLEFESSELHENDSKGLDGAGAPLGSVRIESGRRRARIVLNARAAERGVLIGRDHRCDSVVTSSEISRVHLMVIAIDGELLAVDTGSTAGIYADGRKTPVASLAVHTDGVTLGDDLARVTWVRE